MFDLIKAYHFAAIDASTKYKSAEVIGCTDIGDRYVFDFGVNGEPLIGAPSFVVNKETGDITYISVPPIENLKVLKKGISVDISGFTSI